MKINTTHAVDAELDTLMRAIEVTLDAREAADAAEQQGIFSFCNGSVQDFVDECEPWADDVAHVDAADMDLWVTEWRERLVELGGKRHG